MKKSTKNKKSANQSRKRKCQYWLNRPWDLTRFSWQRWCPSWSLTAKTWFMRCVRLKWAWRTKWSTPGPHQTQSKPTNEFWPISATSTIKLARKTYSKIRSSASRSYVLRSSDSRRSRLLTGLPSQSSPPTNSSWSSWKNFCSWYMACRDPARRIPTSTASYRPFAPDWPKVLWISFFPDWKRR